MQEEEYYEISRIEKLPLRCPILSYCSRRAWTIYLFSEYSKYFPDLDMVEALSKEGEIPKDFIKKEIKLQGESPSIIRGIDHFYFSNVCPEVNLFDNSNSLMPGQACVEGDYDKEYINKKRNIFKTKHFSKCSEFNNYIFENKLIEKSQINKNKRKTIPYKIKALLQKEIKSSCPFCSNSDADHFQVHHIDENPLNNDIYNLIMLCPNCHSKITKKDISNDEVIELKNKLSNKNSSIEFVSVSIDEKNCGWVPYDDTDNAFKLNINKSYFPILNFSFINNTYKTILLKEIKLETKKLPTGLHGPDVPMPNVLRPIIKYKIKLREDEISILKLKNEIEVPKGRAFKFQVELFSDSMKYFRNPFSLEFKFGFNNDVSVTTPRILLNTNFFYSGLKHIVIR